MRTLILVVLITMVLFVSSPVIYLANHSTSMAIQIVTGIVYIAGFLIAIAIAWQAYQSVWKQSTHRLTITDVGLVIKTWILFYVIEVLMQILNELVFHQVGTKNDQAISHLLRSNPTVLLLLSFSVIFLSPVLEELVFRGYLIRGVFDRFPKWLSLVASGLIFSSGHLSSNIISFFIYAFLGMLLAYVYFKSEKIEVAIMVHFLNNLLATILMIISLYKVKG
ncbi:hypothetical protein B808_202 [Fructilactobacillus florum 8D]|uniref:CAAX prenyl protease 2/Lysostaphin resistance protein A-like domain-containing protein n=3 Tax=Fructilactobacillus florum TaxID=640331 RepID=W9EFU9_9LACO|nr:hypothetical protein B807_1047 [Fructilactobacillus florum 2F]ETO40922.1 hypothetical protein B808_202 [Fructilactobacillus florum 8D]KRM91375.1 abortive infection protein [Fructilactobacillus florum DSM 22689 = JCM 16035]